MAVEDWIRDEAAFAKTVDDTAGQNIFGENCYFMPNNRENLMVLDPVLMSVADARCNMDFYYNGGNQFATWGPGLRVDTNNDNDGYYLFLGQSFAASNSLVLMKRQGGIFSALQQLEGSLNSLLENVLYNVEFAIQGNNIEYEIIRVGDQVVMFSGSTTDNTFANVGTTAIYGKPSGAWGVNVYVDNFEAKGY